MNSSKPDLILSGINAGSNIGDEVSYSGTVAAAMEGALRGINSIALSQLGGDHKSNSYLCSKNYSVEIIKNLLKLKIKSPLYFNINFPLNISESDNTNFLYTKLASQKKSDEIFVNNTETSYKIGRMLNSYQTTQETDMDALSKNKISLTPLTLDLTNISLFNQLNKR
jgi:5'-nucleotidase